jgi:hypothetical protein
MYHMNLKTGLLLLFITLVILSGVPNSLASPQYLNVFNEVYGQGSCSTCHIMASDNGFRSDVPNGTFEPRSFNRTNDTQRFNMTNDSRRSNRTAGSRNFNRTMLRNSYGTLFENQEDHANDPSAALRAIGPPSAETSGQTNTRTVPGFGIMVSLFGLFLVSLMVRRHYR